MTQHHLVLLTPTVNSQLIKSNTQINKKRAPQPSMGHITYVFILLWTRSCIQHQNDSVQISQQLQQLGAIIQAHAHLG